MANSDYTKLPEEILLELVNRDNGTSLTTSDVSVSAPAIYTSGSEVGPAHRNWKTKITLTPKVGRGLSGPIELKYNRVPIRHLMHDIPADEDVEFPTGTDSFQIGTAANLVDLLPAMNARFATNILPSDIWDHVLPTFNGPPPYDPVTVKLQAQTTSMVYTGGAFFVLAPNDYPLDQIITNTTLSGPTYTQPPPPPWKERFNTFFTQTVDQPNYW